jgi:hypothetical protein
MTKNLKLILLDLHNQLVQQHNWIPGEMDQVRILPAIAKAPTTQPLVDFINFLNENPQVLDLLKSHGIDWDITNKEVPLGLSNIDQDDPFAGEVLTPPSCRLDNPDCESCQ